MKEKLHCTKAPRQYGIQEIWVCHSACSSFFSCTGLGWLLAIATTRDMALAAASPRRRDNPAPRSRGGGLKAIVLALRENAPGIHFFKTATRNQASVLATFGHQYCLCPPPALCGLGPTGAQRSAPLLPPRHAWCGWTGKYVKTFACREIVLNNLKRCVRLYRPCMRSALQRHAYSSYFGRHCSCDIWLPVLSGRAVNHEVKTTLTTHLTVLA